MEGWVNSGNEGAEGEGFKVTEPVRSFPDTVWRVLLGPRAFFRGMVLGDSLWNPLVFALVCALISIPLTYLVVSLDPFAGEAESLGDIFAGVGDWGLVSVMVLVLAVLVLAPLYVLLVLYIGAAIYQILVGIFVGRGNAGLDATLRVYAYTSVAGLLGWIPIIGYAASLYGFLLMFLGIREMHGTTAGRAFGVVLVPLLVWVFFLFGSRVFFGSG